MFSPHQLLRDLCALPHRGAITPNGKEAARLLQTTLADLGATVRTELFETPRTYVTIIYWLLGGLSVGLALVSVTGVAIGFVWYFALMAWLYFNGRHSFIIRFPVQHTAQNVVGYWPAPKPGPNVRTVILMAHYDTAPVSLLHGPKQQAGFRSRLSLIVSLGLILLAAMAVTLEVFGLGLPYLTYLRYGLIIYFVLQGLVGTLGYWLKGYSNGASDNATGVVAALTTAHRLQQANLPDLAVEVVLTNAQEAGMIGAYYYVERHKRQWDKRRTMAINFDTLGNGKLLVVDQTGTLETIHYDNKPTKIARSLLETSTFQDKVQVGRWPNAEFDSVWFVRNNIPVLALSALNTNDSAPPVHQPDHDTLDAVDLTPMNTAIDLAEAVIETWLVE